MKTYRFIVHGRVQGVWYRKTIQEKALKEGITGYVKNLQDGSVEVVANLKKEDIEKFLKILKKGSPLSRVDNIEMGEIMPTYFETFEVRY